jgi:NAD(P)-dependent dehydrogenase (short-subunit alcohol dehydrogenase family)
MGWLDGQVALVTGGGSGIGRAIVARYIAEGARVGVLERVAARAAEVKSEFGDKLVSIAGDVTRLADNRRAVSDTVAAFGRLDVFVGNAGVFDNFAKLEELDDNQLGPAFDELFGVNVKGVLHGAKAALGELRKSHGCMIFTASVAGFNSNGGGAMYTGSKHAVVGIVKQLAVELAPEIRVNAVAPGGVPTDLRGLGALGEEGRSHFQNPNTEERLRSGNPLGAVIQPSDLAAAYLFLASRENARTITGTVLGVDAGALLRQPRR